MTSDRLTVRDLVMRQEIPGMFGVSPTDPVRQAASAMQAHGVSAIAVLIESKTGLELVGILSEKDISHLVARGGDPARTPVGSIMTADPITVDINTPLWETAKYMLDHNVRHLPVFESGQPSTTISMRDVLDLLLERLAVEVQNLRADLDWIGYMRGDET